MDIKQDIYSIDFAKTKVIWFADTPLIVPDTFTFEQEKYVKAALRTLFYGNTSVDNILKSSYFKDHVEVLLEHERSYENSELKEYDDLRNTFFQFQEKIYLKYKQVLRNINFEGKSNAYSHCGIIYKKLDSNFSALRMLIKYDYIYECYAIIRQIIEQIAFAYDTQFRNEIEDFQSPTKSISKLKEFYPKIGILYGELSSKTHIDSSQFQNHFYVNLKNKEDAGVILRSRKKTFSICHRALIMLDLYACVFEHIFYDEINDFSCIKKNRTLLKKRETRNYINVFAKDYNKLMKKKIAKDD
ncbi:MULTISPECIES: hypothetical protein [unclassified Chryseobacterium]|uniref:hypothetical protein n=1 Tax=unclassified Chryseobacterium TaxID=2593645 RepID=UPI00100B98AA|nr:MULTISPECIES: hypothetical protein [unclassified Chryseobacterium]RXM50538.1 hypothetical protein BOQ64_17465 [Chryseobacterium sp. CH25]RXM63172.1 hypothetical protein BOQ60_17665 [Chryseobacterium sp. CH1]